MKKATAIGIDNYREIIEKDYYVVDKTLLIKDFLDNTGTMVTLITRPRRFGKTLNMSMMAEFFDVTKDSKDIFKDTNIMKTEYASCINQYPVIYLTFKDASGSKEKVVSRIKEQLQNVYDYYQFVLDSVNMSRYIEKRYKKIDEGLMEDTSLSNITNAISFMMNMLYQYYHKKVMVFIDEYDTPFIEAHIHGFYNDVHEDLSSILCETFKANSYLEYGLLTGIQRVAKENTFSRFNNPIVCSMTDDMYCQYFGFNYNETKELLEYYNLNLSDEVKSMYDGYHIGNSHVYNPWSILNYAETHKLKPYWVNTSSNIMIRNAMKDADISFKSGFETLIEQGYLDTTVKMETSFYEESETSTLWGLFINAGYLTIEKELPTVINASNKRYRITIPNQEVVDEFKIFLTTYFHISSVDFLDNIIQSLLDEDKDVFLDSYSKLLMASSYHDLTSENSYHMLLYPLCLY
ncbi:MAG: AAA family ATPase, partial [Erysipelotrichaceae bacterium]|nr:AAA family ATPase [Erysipelotrichaceae bacterium]